MSKSEKDKVRLAIVGSRTFDDYELLAGTILKFFRIKTIEEIISGEAKGADQLAGDFAYNNSLTCTVFPALWKRHGRMAGFIRNQQIVDACDVLMAFWDGKSAGTRDSLEKARKAKKPTITVYV